MSLVHVVITCLLYFTSFISAADTSAWRSRSIYFVLTDRIARSSSDTGGGSCSDLGNYCGGTFKGLESKLDYIKGLGFDAIWITPVVASKSNLHTNMNLYLNFLQTALEVIMAIGHKIFILSTPIMAQLMILRAWLALLTTKSV